MTCCELWILQKYLTQTQLCISTQRWDFFSLCLKRPLKTVCKLLRVCQKPPGSYEGSGITRSVYSVNKTSSILPKALADAQLDLVKIIPHNKRHAVIQSTHARLYSDHSSWYNQDDMLIQLMNPIHLVLVKKPERKTTTSRHSQMSTGSELMASGTWEGLDQPSKLTVDDNFKVDFTTSPICMSWGWSLFSSFGTYILTVTEYQKTNGKTAGKSAIDGITCHPCVDLLARCPGGGRTRTWALTKGDVLQTKGWSKGKRHTSNVQSTKTTTTTS